MSGHSKWSKIKRKKGASDEKRAKIFSKLGKTISVAARSGGDPDFNFQLRLAIDQAKAVNMPKDNIDRAVAKGAGAGEGIELKEMIYEGFGPAGVAVIVTALSDNANRTASDVKHIFTKNGGSLGGPGSVMWQFERFGVIRVRSQESGIRNQELELIEAGMENLKEEDDEFIIFTKIENMKKVKDVIDEENIKVESAEIEYVAKEEKEVSEEDGEKVMHFMELLDDNDDVSDVFTNVK